jgi:hypothetical protein
MTDPKPPAERLRAILVLVATAATIIFNSLASAGYLNGVTPEVISNKYTTLMTPAGYAFAIWSLIYLGIAAFSIYQFLPDNLERLVGVRTLFLITCVLNCGWVYFWHHEQLVVCFVLILLLAVTLFLIVLRLRHIEKTGEYWLARVPFSIYCGWVTAATLVSIPITLAYLGMPQAGSLLPVVLISIATLLGVFVRIRLRDYIYPLAIAWALTAIAVKQSGQTAIVVACAIGVVANLIAGFTFVINPPSHSTTESAAK